MRRGIWFACFGFSIALASGCGGTASPPLPVKGTVILDGKPMPDGEISFMLCDDKNQPLGGAPSVMPIKDGAFSGTASTGKNRVEIRAYKEGKPLSTDPTGTPPKVNYMPDRFNFKSTLNADVTAGGANDFKFEAASY